MKHLQQRGAGDAVEFAAPGGDHVDRSWPPFERRHFADDGAVAQRRQPDLEALWGPGEDLDLAFVHHIDRVAGISRLAENLARHQFDGGSGLGHSKAGAVRKAVKHMRIPEMGDDAIMVLAVGLHLMTHSVEIIDEPARHRLRSPRRIKL